MAELLDPTDLMFREHDQDSRKVAELAELFAEGEYAPIVVVAETLEIIDGHHRARAAIANGHQIQAVTITQADYQRLSAAGYDDMEVAFAALLLDGESDTAYSIDAAFGGIVAPRGLAAYDIL